MNEEEEEMRATHQYCREDRRIQKGAHEERCKQRFEDGGGPRESVGRQSPWNGSVSKRSTKKTIGQHGGKGTICFCVAFLGSQQSGH